MLISAIVAILIVAWGTIKSIRKQEICVKEE
jgi:hypothetical protein